ncbi:MAG: AbrB family transcriptional regulator [Candidatus Velthaea sp.]
MISRGASGWAWAGLVAASAAVSATLEAAGFPAALLLGPMLVAIVFGSRGATIGVPRWLFLGAQGVVGCLIARSVTGAIVTSVVRNWALMLVIVLTTVVASAVVGWLLARFGHLGASTAAWGSSPGAAAAMTAMSEDYGADPRLVAVMQYARVLIVVMTASVVARLLLGVTAQHAPAAPTTAALPPLLPFAATLLVALGGTWFGRRLRVPSGALLVPLVAAAVLHGSGRLEITLPVWLLDVTYASIGWYIGLTFTRETVRLAARAFPQLLAATAALIALCAASGWMLAALLRVDPLTAYLATTPGGLDSVAIIALGSGANVSLVLAIQTLRVLVVIVTGPPLAKLIARYA